jgi:hypothetical protein
MEIRNTRHKIQTRPTMILRWSMDVKNERELVQSSKKSIVLRLAAEGVCRFLGQFLAANTSFLS